ncbi:MAG TPA: hypothetical protein VH062_00395 [Polyangiaceae bacterium]|jgi:hypothetical protein|nr:hypothetical protein [Polyangiaceae bacterium]
MAAAFAIFGLSGCSTGAEKLVKAYAGVENCSDRVQFILNPVENGPRLIDAYKDVKDCTVKYKSIDASSCKDVAPGTHCTVRAVFKDDSKMDYCIARTQADFKVDWLCSKGWNPISLKVLRADQPRQPARFRLFAELSDYYNYDYRDAKPTHYSIHLTDDDRQEIQGYMSRSAPDAVTLHDTLKDGKKHRVIVRLAYGSHASEAGVIEITRFYQEGWAQLPEDVGAPDAVELRAAVVPAGSTESDVDEMLKGAFDDKPAQSAAAAQSSGVRPVQSARSPMPTAPGAGADNLR